MDFYDRLMRLLSQAGFQDVRRLDDPFEGPVIVAVKAANSIADKGP